MSRATFTPGRGARLDDSGDPHLVHVRRPGMPGCATTGVWQAVSNGHHVLVIGSAHVRFRLADGRAAGTWYARYELAPEEIARCAAFAAEGDATMSDAKTPRGATEGRR